MNYLIVPDLHGQYYTFIEMLKKFIKINKYNQIVDTKKYQIILLGDFIDKGNKEEQKLLIEFIYENLNHFIILLGNHEYKTMKKIEDEEIVLSKYYDCYNNLLKEDIFLKDKFREIFKEQVSCFETEKFICTHSPCLQKHIRRRNGNMVQYSFKRKDKFLDSEQYEQYLRDFFTDIVVENNNDKLHIFGHLGLDNVMINGSQIWLDTSDITDITFLEIKKDKLIFHNNNNNKEIIHNTYEDCLETIINKFKYLEY